MKLKYKTNFSGFICLLRAIQLFLKDETLNFTQLGAYICFTAQVDFDPKHPNYKIILRDDNELAKEWGCSPSTVYRNRQYLISKGLLVEKDGNTQVPNFYIFELKLVQSIVKLPPALIQQFFTKTENEVAKMTSSIAELQENQDQNGIQSSSISSKSDLSSSEDLRGSDAYLEGDIDSLLNKVDNESIGDEDE
ncbi:hypothetical protein A2697_02595 [Candidatus Curtissbacteria bacterium RIFCSPHIGHO2_01_FULL_41_44]|uniref:Uncharacterized protein n=1 Tax=Candidatus Curtissbacteria bacterium RIFCSPLOWO2_01_FULL_42_50 TaxID=1797730 RepID=A0A1F5H2J4_9BACT|nr:MAG: hypothetical protein A2697_02595 [Candidatus Curtissbacteria bacterium RIFCSPHIGHO2_01_FULL_41_44]OGD92866.1 MAG: hypothetical protein A3C33_02110 [Candidatus Curtissbacteria bacterium RIFCSPHIGHO2_02_FULL_42_58]OGD96583.1 MAG: hypothetical protein A3E71_02760 [Candidatus Curtissbacteria bacterium RIFCSPHIGHO2_12_FULL_42_33]OGD98284.1 MAG: hypothetical protein A3B54_04200 [Candidatus Curtissbacteria bacterium RIFCSPLOWO2_01_FULL_42_50]OGE10356.1 MAG: hypothetical protein A3H87_02120 [Ca